MWESINWPTVQEFHRQGAIPAESLWSVQGTKKFNNMEQDDLFTFVSSARKMFLGTFNLLV